MTDTEALRQAAMRLAGDDPALARRLTALADQLGHPAPGQLVDLAAQAIRQLSRTDRLSEQTTAQAVIDALQLSPQTRDVWPPEESGMSGPLKQTCWQTPWTTAT